MKRGIQKVFALCMCLLLCVSVLTPMTSFAASANGTGKICKWKQTDARWEKVYSAKWYQGCAVTAIAIQIARTDLVTPNNKATSFNKKTGEGFNPGTFAKAWNKAGALKSSLSVTWASTTKVVPAFVNVTTKNVLKSIDKNTPNRSSAGWHYYNATSKKQICKSMKYYLDKGYYPIIEGPGSKWKSNKSSVHYVAVIKATSSDVRVIDPADGKEKSLFSVSVGGGKWTYSNIEKCGKPKGYGCCRLYKVDASKKPTPTTPTTPTTPADPAAEYMEKCSKAADTYISLKVTSSSDYIKSLPCAKGTCSASADVRKLVAGEILTATAIYKNTGGNYWYKVKANSDGKEGYVYGAITVPNGSKAPSGAVTGNAVVPETVAYGKAQTVSGTLKVKSDSGLKLTIVKGWLYESKCDPNNTEDFKNYAKATDINATSFTIAGSAIDSKFKFAALAKGKGHIRLKLYLEAKYISGAKTLGTTTLNFWPGYVYFTVK